MKPPKQPSPPPLPSPPPPPMDESPLSPLRTTSTLRSDQPDRTKPSTASLEKYYSPLTSPLPGSPTAATSHVINLGRVVAARGGERGVGDSRFCLSINVIGFVYAGFQALDQAYHLATGKHLVMHHLRHHHFDFVIDQVLAYLLISASSAAATRVVDWELNWGKDAFTEKASASVSMSFLAFIAFAISSLISGYNICNREFA